MVNAFMREHIPIVKTIENYNSGKFNADLVGGITIFFTVIPQSLAYATLAGLEPVYGLYASSFPLFVYAILGTSNHLVFGPFAITSFMLGSVCSQYPEYEKMTPEYTELALFISFCSGLFFLLFWALNAGNFVSYITESVNTGFITGSASLVFLHQVQNVLGYRIHHHKYTHQIIIALLEKLPETKWIALLISVPSFCLLYYSSTYKKARPPCSAEHKRTVAYKLITVFLATSYFIVFMIGIFVSYLVLSGSDGEGSQNPSVAAQDLLIVGKIPSGFFPPKFGFKYLDLSIIVQVVPNALTIALVAWMCNWAVAKKFADQFRYRVDVQKELFAYAIVNILGATCMNSFINAGGMARSALAVEIGAKTQFAYVISASMVIASVFFMGPMLRYIPLASLGAIVMAAVMGMINFSVMMDTYRTSPRQAAVMVVTFICTFWLGVTQGMALGILCSVLAEMSTNSSPPLTVLGPCQASDGSWTFEPLPLPPPDSTPDRSTDAEKLNKLYADGTTSSTNTSTNSNSNSSNSSNSADNGACVGGVDNDSTNTNTIPVALPTALPGVTIVRCEATSLFFGNAAHLRDNLVNCLPVSLDSTTGMPTGKPRVDVESMASSGEIEGDSTNNNNNNNDNNNLNLGYESARLEVLIVDLPRVVHADGAAIKALVALRKTMLLQRNAILAFVWDTSVCDAGLDKLAQPFADRLTTTDTTDSVNSNGENNGNNGNNGNFNKNGDGDRVGDKKKEKEKESLSRKGGYAAQSLPIVFRSLEEAVRYYSLQLCLDSLLYDPTGQAAGDQSCGLKSNRDGGAAGALTAKDAIPAPAHVGVSLGAVTDIPPQPKFNLNGQEKDKGMEMTSQTESPLHKRGPRQGQGQSGTTGSPSGKSL